MFQTRSHSAKGPCNHYTRVMVNSPDIKVGNTSSNLGRIIQFYNYSQSSGEGHDRIILNLKNILLNRQHTKL